ncbi:MAG TPA: hypothetical protein VFJ29_06425, partial [Candidatus Kapabacteria bacterium]|nr:hypothetical protein [Candidatus Kapabacteria bacterium]
MKVRYIIIVLACIVVAACQKQREAGTLTSNPLGVCNGITFTDITKQAGITWEHCNGAFGRRLMPEIKGSGCAIIDYNNDGWPDILFINAQHWPGHRTANEPTMA